MQRITEFITKVPHPLSRTSSDARDWKLQVQNKIFKLTTAGKDLAWTISLIYEVLVVVLCTVKNLDRNRLNWTTFSGSYEFLTNILRSFPVPYIYHYFSTLHKLRSIMELSAECRGWSCELASNVADLPVACPLAWMNCLQAPWPVRSFFVLCWWNGRLLPFFRCFNATHFQLRIILNWTRWLVSPCVYEVWTIFIDSDDMIYISMSFLSVFLLPTGVRLHRSQRIVGNKCDRHKMRSNVKALESSIYSIKTKLVLSLLIHGYTCWITAKKKVSPYIDGGKGWQN